MLRAGGKQGHQIGVCGQRFKSKITSKSHHHLMWGRLQEALGCKMGLGMRNSASFTSTC